MKRIKKITYVSLLIIFSTIITILNINCAIPPDDSVDYDFRVQQPSASYLNSGESVNIPVSVTRSTQNEEDIGFKCEGLPAGVTWEFNPNPISGTVSATMLTLTSDGNTLPGTYEFTIVMECPPSDMSHHPEITQTTTAELIVDEPDNDFVFSVNPMEITIPKGQSGNLNINLLRYNFPDAVNFSTTYSNIHIFGSSADPIDTTFSVNPVTGNNTVLTLFIHPNAAYVDFYTTYATVTITGRSGSKIKRRSFRLYLSEPTGGDFSLNVEANLSILEGSSLNPITIDVIRTGGHSESIDLSINNFPANTNYSFDPNPVPANENSSLLTLTADYSAVPGVYHPDFIGDDGINVKVYNFDFEILDQYTISTDPDSISIAQGQFNTVNINIDFSRSEVYNEMVFTVEGGIIGAGPSSVDTTFSPNPVPWGTWSTQLKLTVGQSVATGIYPLTIKGATTNLVKSTDLQLVVP